MGPRARGRTGGRLLRAAGWGAVAALLLLGVPVRADLAPEPLGRVETVGPPRPHWALYFDMHLSTFLSGRYVLFDADTLDFVAWISTGQFPTLQIAPDGREIYVVDTFLHGPSARREDVVAIYDTKTFALRHEIPLPQNRRALMPPVNRSALVHGGRLLVVFNFTPATSIDVIDLAERRFLREIPTPGCSLVYATGPDGVSLLCGDGALLTLNLDAQGRVRSRSRSEPFFDPDRDPVMENAARIGGTWYFPSYGGDVYPVDLSGPEAVPGEPWALVDHDAQPAGLLRALLTLGKAGPWLPGGSQLMAAHEARGELYVLVHPTLWSQQQTPSMGDHVFPGAEVWVYDVARRVRTRRIALEGVGISIFVTPDPEPLLLVAGADMGTEQMRLEVYDAVSGTYLRHLPEFGQMVMGFHGIPVGR